MYAQKTALKNKEYDIRSMDQNLHKLKNETLTRNLNIDS